MKFIKYLPLNQSLKSYNFYPTYHLNRQHTASMIQRKILVFIVFLSLSILTVTRNYQNLTELDLPQVEPASPICQTGQVADLIPISIGETLTFDLEWLFYGYNLEITGPKSQYIKLNPKYSINSQKFNKTYNFIDGKIKKSNKFIGLVEDGNKTVVLVGYNYEDSGVSIQNQIQVESEAHIQCFDVDEVFSVGGYPYAIVDCAVFTTEVNKKLKYNEFFFVDLYDFKIVQGSKISDVFVNFNKLTKRSIQAYIDPVTKAQYLWRFITKDSVDFEHQINTYAEIFLVTDPMNPKLLDVIDHTYANQKYFRLADFQIYNGFVYLLNYNNGIYRIKMDATQRPIIYNFFSIKLDCYAFRVDQLGNSDDLYLVLSNGHTAFQYDWDLLGQPTLTTKYNLMPQSYIEEIFVDYNFVVIQSVHNISSKPQRKVWIYTRFTFSYTYAYASFDVPTDSSYIIQWQQHGNAFHIYTANSSYNVYVYKPYLYISPVSASLAGQTEQYLVSANSSAGNGIYKTCSIKMKFIYIEATNTSVFKNVDYQNKNIFVDAPDKWELDNLEWQFFGPNLTYNVKYDINSSILPRTYIDKQHNAFIQWPQFINPANIVFFQMFTEGNFEERKDFTEVRGIVQTKDNETSFPIHYIACQVDVMQQTQEHSLKCRIVSTSAFDDTKGVIKKCSHMFDPLERRIAIVFSANPNKVEVYYIAMFYMIYYGKVAYDGIHTGQITGMTIANGFLYCVSTNGKYVDIYNLQDIADNGSFNPKPSPVFTIDKTVTSFYGVPYFAPVDAQSSPKHKNTIFIKTKIGVMALKVNRNAQPQFLFILSVPTSRYDFEISSQIIMIITETNLAMYRMEKPLRADGKVFFRQRVQHKFNLKEYDQINGDELFYVVNDNGIGVLNPRLFSTSVIYSEFSVGDIIENIDAVSINDKQMLFIHTKKQIKVVVFAKSPKFKLSWFPQQIDFKVNLTAQSGVDQTKKSDPASFNFKVIQQEDPEIKPTEFFNATQIRNLGHIETDQNSQYLSANLTLNDTLWFNNTIIRFTIQCNGQNNTECKDHLKDIHLRNHVREEREVVAARAIYDLQANYGGIIAQQYQSIFKTFAHNDSIETMVTIPTSSRGQICTKLAVANGMEYLVSLCETGQEVNMYVTTYSSFKPISIGPILSQAKAVNKAEIAEDILMIVDNDDNPFARAGGIYLYLLDTNPSDRVFNFLDYIDWQDIQSINGVKGGPAIISSAHLHKPSSLSQHFQLFITDANMGNIYVMTFKISADREEIIYLSRKIIPLAKLIPSDIAFPTPLRIYTISLTNYFSDDQKNQTEYFFILTVANWHHMEISVTLDKTDEVLTFGLTRLFKRYFWDLENYVKYRPGFFNDSYFAVPYLNHELGRQIVAVYQIPKQVPWQQTQQYMTYKKGNKLVRLPIINMIGSHWVRDAYQVAFDFSDRISHNLLFVDVDAYNITELSIHPNVTLNIHNVSKPFNLSVVAHNGMSNFTFEIEVYLTPNETQIEIIWAAIMLIGLIMIIGLIIVWVRQNKKKRDQDGQIRESLITKDSIYQNTYINRSSVDTDSVRNTIDMRDQLEPPKTNTDGNGNMQKIKEEDQEQAQVEERKSNDQEQNEAQGRNQQPVK